MTFYLYKADFSTLKYFEKFLIPRNLSKNTYMYYKYFIHYIYFRNFFITVGFKIPQNNKESQHMTSTNIDLYFVTNGKKLATAYQCKFIETSTEMSLNLDELLVGIVRQASLKKKQNERCSSSKIRGHYYPDFLTVTQ